MKKNMTNVELIEWAKDEARKSEKVNEMVKVLRSASVEELKEIRRDIRKRVNRVRKHKNIVDYDIFNIMIELQSDPRINIYDYAAFMIIDKNI